MSYFRGINQKIGAEEVIQKADELYKLYGKSDLAKTAEKNLKELQ